MPTWAEIKTEIEDEYDLAEETFIDDTELLGYANAAIQEIEKEIHTFRDKYFEADAPIALVQGTADYDLPNDIYANKITGVFYNSGGSITATGSERYEILPIKELKKLLDVDVADEYGYRISNSTASGTKLKLFPVSRETSSTNVTIFYIRNAKLLVDDTDELDIPEAKQFVKQYVVEKSKNKEMMTPDAPPSPALQLMKKNLLESLEHMIADDNNEIIVDMSHYAESV